MILEETLIYHGTIFPRVKTTTKKWLYRKKESTTYFIKKKKKRKILPIMVIFLQLINVPTFIRMILIGFHFCLKLVSLSRHKIFDLTKYVGKLSGRSLM